MSLSSSQNWAAEIQGQLPLLRELNDCKRLYAGNLGSDSFATSIFRRACLQVSGGMDLQAEVWCAAIVVGARLGAITPIVLRNIGLTEPQRIAVLERAVLAHGALPDAVKRSLVSACPILDSAFTPDSASCPDWAQRLSAAPRAGATCPGKPRISLEPAEMHSDHCVMVATYGYLLADFFGANRDDAWLIGLCHHFHNAFLPDAGFTGEMLLGDHLQSIISELRSRVVSSLPEPFHAKVSRLFEEIAGTETPLAKTFHAADTIDRVLQMENYERVGKFRVEHALVDLNLVHEGAAQSFQNDLLKSIGLLPSSIP